MSSQDYHLRDPENAEKMADAKSRRHESEGPKFEYHFGHLFLSQSKFNQSVSFQHCRIITVQKLMEEKEKKKIILSRFLYRSNTKMAKNSW